jgi:hypothetical protein
VGGGIVVVIVGIGDEIIIDDLDLSGASTLPLGTGGIVFLSLLLDILIAA